MLIYELKSGEKVFRRDNTIIVDLPGPWSVRDPRPALPGFSIGERGVEPAGRLISLFIGLVNRSIR